MDRSTAMDRPLGTRVHATNEYDKENLMWHSMLPREGKISIEVRPGIHLGLSSVVRLLRRSAAALAIARSSHGPGETGIDRYSPVASTRGVSIANCKLRS